MDLILWRHADAEDSADDMARGLRAHLPADTRVIVSPARRAQETAQALPSDFDTVAAIAPGASHLAVLAAAH